MKAIKTFIESGRRTGFKRIAESPFLMDLNVKKQAEIRARYTNAYRNLKAVLSICCGEPIVEDARPEEIRSMALSFNERCADLLTLYQAHGCRFGALLYQPDEAMPIELCVTAYNPQGEASPQDSHFEANHQQTIGRLTWDGHVYPLTENDFAFQQMELDHGRLQCTLRKDTERDLAFSAHICAPWRKPFQLADTERAVKTLFQSIQEVRLKPSEALFSLSAESISADVAMNESAGSKRDIAGDRYCEWVESDFDHRFGPREWQRAETVRCNVEAHYETTRSEPARTGDRRICVPVSLDVAVVLTGNQGQSRTLELSATLPFVFHQSDGCSQPQPFIEAVIRRPWGSPGSKLAAIQHYLEQGLTIPAVFWDGRLAVFHLIDSINPSPKQWTSSDSRYIELVLSQLPSAQFGAIEPDSGLDAISYCRLKKGRAVSDYLASCKPR
ncbi:hypothetical protein KUV89_18775 [Marinobacter hydrocarbonoclasticus]|nr:hypothetical protein [Marinobacter nauticus]